MNCGNCGKPSDHYLRVILFKVEPDPADEVNEVRRVEIDCCEECGKNVLDEAIKSGGEEVSPDSPAINARLDYCDVPQV